MSNHQYRTEVDYLGSVVEIEIHFNYFPGEPERRPTYSSGGEPAVSEEVEIYKVLIATGGSLEPVPYIPESFYSDYDDELIEAVKQGEC